MKRNLLRIGYLRNTDVFRVSLDYVDENTPMVEVEIPAILDEEPRGELKIIKRDSETDDKPQGDAKFLNAVYKVYAAEDIYNVARSKKFFSKDDLVATTYMSETGENTITDLPIGKYYVKEFDQPDGYFIDEERYNVNLAYLDQDTPIIYAEVVSHEKVKKQQIHLFKSGIKVNSDETPGLEGAEFTIKLKSNVDEALNRGYTYEEIWGGVDRAGNKVSVDTTRMNEAQEIAPTYEVIKTDNNGNAYTQKKLPYGRYICKETYTPVDFESAQDFAFSVILDESEISDLSKKVKDIVVNDEQLETYIKLVKKDTKTGKNVSLNSATFQIYATEDIYDRATGDILHQRGYPIHQKLGATTFDSFTTNSDNLIVPAKSFTDREVDKGTVTVPLKLEVGGYEIREISLPDGFLKLEKPIKFRVEGIRDYDLDQDDEFIMEIVINNEQPTRNT